ncbi:MAG TPA: C40 family peptidase [Chitinophagales bacterium]|nr:C40 family peptidase [Chitinophagales bacterium]
MLESGITKISLLPVRSEPRQQAELVTQLLFGEMYTIHEKQGEWLRIVTHSDQYSGFINVSQHSPLDARTARDLENSDKSVVLDLVHSITENDRKFPVSIGSILYHFDGVTARIGKDKYHFSGKTIPSGQGFGQPDMIIKLAMKLLHAPYLSGGRGPFGIDCSGFVQLVYRCAGVELPRDAWQQAATGKTLHFIHEARAGDLAFFSNEEGRIIHVGMLMGDGTIIHASGMVRIDTIDHYGIFRKDIRKYSHQLRIIKRIL